MKISGADLEAASGLGSDRLRARFPWSTWGAIAASMFLGVAPVAALFTVPAFRWVFGAALATVIAGVVIDERRRGWRDGSISDAALLLAVAGVLAFLVFDSFAGWGIPFGIAAAGTLLGSLGCVGWWLWRRFDPRSKPIRRLVAAADRFNQLARAVVVKEELLAAQGRNPDPAQHDSAMRAVAQAREQLLQAIRVDRVMRENREVIGALESRELETSLVTIDADAVREAGEELAGLVQQTVEVSAEVQREIAEIGRR